MDDFVRVIITYPVKTGRPNFLYAWVILEESNVFPIQLYNYRAENIRGVPVYFERMGATPQLLRPHPGFILLSPVTASFR